MGSRFPGLGFANNAIYNASKRMGEVLQAGGPIADCPADTSLRLDSFSFLPHLPTPKGIKRKWSWMNESSEHKVAPSLSLGLGHSSSSSDSKGSSGSASSAVSSAKEAEEHSSMDLDLDFTLHLGNANSPSSKKFADSNLKTLVNQAKIDLELSLSTWPSESVITNVLQGSTGTRKGFNLPQGIKATQLWGNEAATSHCTLGALSPGFIEGNSLVQQIPGNENPTLSVPDLSGNLLSASKSSVTYTSGIVEERLQQQAPRGSSSKLCKYTGCEKGARGASGFCIAHGGGRRCQKPGCHKGAEGRTAFCKAHGGGRRCESLGCTKSAEGRTDFCIAHGGGRRCSHENCTRAARGKSGLCIRHGGGKRCQRENCTRSAEGLSGLCISHGGGRRCQYAACTKGAQGSTMFCKAHGGGKRCTVEGCAKGAEGSTPFCKGHGGGKRCSYPSCPKSVHGGTSFCVAHGGGKRCAVPDCTKSARGRTDFCVRHGGGKRCKSEGCGKSAQGSTDFCKAHGGGKRCLWGQPGSDYGNLADGPCGSFARGKMGLCTMHGALVQDKRVHGGVTLGVIFQDPKLKRPENIEEVLSRDMIADNIDIGGGGGGSHFYMNDSHLSPAVKGSSSGPIPEGRVHGGSLMAVLKNGPDLRLSNITLACSPYEPM